jgi:hypothetical protein
MSPAPKERTKVENVPLGRLLPMGEGAPRRGSEKRAAAA